MRPPTQAQIRELLDQLCYDQFGSYRHIEAGDYPPYPELARNLARTIRYTKPEAALIEEWAGATVWRGYWAPEGEEETHSGWQSIHWTRNRDLAVWFATRVWGIRESVGMAPMLAQFTPRNVLDVLWVPPAEWRDESETLIRIDRVKREDVTIERLPIPVRGA